jgi:hypothetical protein
MTDIVQQNGVQTDKMKESPRVWGDTDFSEVEGSDIDETKIFWMGTNANLADTPQEQLENRLAIQEQVNRGILDEFGLPIGFSYDELGIPKEKQDEINAARAARRQQTIHGRAQSIPQHVNLPGRTTGSGQPEVKKYRSKMERKMNREKMREEAKRQEKLARANQQIRQHQNVVVAPKPPIAPITNTLLINNITLGN